MNNISKESLYQMMDERLNREFKAAVEMSDYIFSHPELGGEEYQSSSYICGYLKERGFRITHPCESLPTAFVDEFVPDSAKEDGTVIAFVAEYDALPGFGENGGPGHACGHNWISACMCACAAVLSETAEQLGCRVRLIGTPAEESFGGKYTMIQDGVFDDVDFAFQAHLDEFTSIETVSLAMNSIEFTFHGVAAHAAQNPEKGVNALDAVVTMYNGVNTMRQYLGRDDRIHGIITAGGTAANTIPDFAQCRFSIRSRTKGGLAKLRTKLLNVAKGAELSTGAVLEYRDYENPFDDMINVLSFTDVCKKHLCRFGYDHFMPEDQYPGSGSSDIGNVSYVCPTVYMEIAPKEGDAVIVHDASAMGTVNTRFTMDTLKTVVKAYSRAAADICLDPELQKTIKSEHMKIRDRRNKA